MFFYSTYFLSFVRRLNAENILCKLIREFFTTAGTVYSKLLLWKINNLCKKNRCSFEMENL